MSYTFNLEVVNINPDKLLNIRFAEGKDSMEQVGVDDWVFSNTAQITKTDEQLKNTSLFGLVYEAYRPLLDDRDFGIVILGVGMPLRYKYFMKDFKSSDEAGRFFNHLYYSRNSRKKMFESSAVTIKEKVTDPLGAFDKNDLYGWCTPRDKKPNDFNIKIFPYPLSDIVTSYTDSGYIYNLNGLSDPFVNKSLQGPKRTHPDVLGNIINRYMQLFFPEFHVLGHMPDDIDAERFQKKYLKYKKKYLQLKNNFM